MYKCSTFNSGASNNSPFHTETNSLKETSTSSKRKYLAPTSQSEAGSQTSKVTVAARKQINNLPFLSSGAVENRHKKIRPPTISQEKMLAAAVAARDQASSTRPIRPKTITRRSLLLAAEKVRKQINDESNRQPAPNHHKVINRPTPASPTEILLAAARVQVKNGSNDNTNAPPPYPKKTIFLPTTITQSTDHSNPSYFGDKKPLPAIGTVIRTSEEKK